jgi:hypothetical protein
MIRSVCYTGEAVHVLHGSVPRSMPDLNQVTLEQRATWRAVFSPDHRDTLTVDFDSLIQ